MKAKSIACLIGFFGLAAAAPTPASPAKKYLSLPLAMLRGREVPQEHSHDRFLDGVRVNLDLNNPNKIEDPVFGLLGDAAAAAGAGSIKNLECLHQATADQAFTNAKAAGNVTGQADALMYAALERNTGKVGLASVLCNETAVNPEIGAISQHQDPASPNAAATNKAIVLELAKQLASIGADPQEALLSGTFAPGNLDDTTGKGNSCDTPNDGPGCIFVEHLLIDDATAAEISAAVAGVSAGKSVAASSSPASSSTASSSPASASTASGVCSLSASAPAKAAAPPATTSSSASSVATGTNIQTFTGTLGGPPPVVISTAASDRPFSVNGNTFVNAAAAIQRSCSIQNNACADAVNSGKLSGKTVGDCNTQEDQCNAASSGNAKRAALDFGSCGSPAILFENGLDGRTQPAFIPADLTSYNHGSALNIGVIASFICGQLATACKAPDATQTACTAAEAAASAAGGTTQAAATAWNNALGVSGGSSAVSSGGSCPAVAVSSASSSSSETASPSSSTSSAAGTDVQTFTGSLGGTPPPVLETSGARPFSVNGDTFVNRSAALQRSCSVQNNACADAVNSGKLEGKSVSDCNAQQQQCDAAGGVN